MLSIVMPAKNEALALEKHLTKLQAFAAKHTEAVEIILVDDGSTDNTALIANSFNIKVISHPYSKGNGAAIKTGAREAQGEVIVFMDADGQHSPDDIPMLLEQYNQGFDMIVGARDKSSQASIGRSWANGFYNKLASYMTSQKVEDLTSGFRVVNAKKFREFLHLYPNGFSYPTTSTMAFFRAGYSVGYHPIKAAIREGKSHINPMKDGIRFLLIIFKIGTLYSPLKIFFPISLSISLIGISYYMYTFITMGRFTNMSALMFTTALVIFMVGLVSEQITSLMYNQKE